MNTITLRRSAGVPPAIVQRIAHAAMRARRPHPHYQRGVSMFIVLVIMLLALILVLGGLTVTNLNESIVGNQSDVQRTYASAQALIDAAQRDIRLNGRDCDAAILGGNGSNSKFKLGAADVACTLRFPRDLPDYMDMVTGAPGMSQCANGVCISQGPADTAFAGNTVNDTGNIQQWANGAAYTQFVYRLDNSGATGTAYGGGATTGTGFTLAANGRYWVEVFPYFSNTVSAGGMRNAPVPDGAYPFVFRITAMARGLKGGTVSVLRTYYTPIPMAPAP